MATHAPIETPAPADSPSDRAEETRSRSGASTRWAASRPAQDERWPSGPQREGPASLPVFAAYYYPGWHASPARSVRGERTEWALLFGDAAPYPDARRPLRGPVAATPETLEAETQEAHAGGIDAFIWCWYWDRGRRTLGEALDLFLECRRPEGFRYALAWVTKRPYASLPLSRTPSPLVQWRREIPTDEADFRAMIGHLIARHWSRPDYLRVDGRPYLPIIFIEPLIRQLGVRRLARLLAGGDAQARAAGFAGIYYVAVIYGPHTRRRGLRRLGLGRWVGDAPLRDLGLEAVSTYVHLPDWKGPAVQWYPALIDARERQWDGLSDHFGLPFWPSVSPGWDARPRGVPLERPPVRHPWAPVVRGETPAEFGRLLGAWRAFAQRAGGLPVLPLSSWNEWSEGHAIAPCTRHGEGMLAALRAFKDGLGTAVRAGSSAVAATR